MRYVAFMQGLRDAIDARIRTTHEGDKRAIATALLTGRRDAITTPVNDAMFISGLGHVLSISGYHMAVVAGVVFFAVRALLALIPGLTVSVPIKKWAAAAALVAAAFWLATRSLVRGANDTGRRQLRAYLSVNPKKSANFVTGGFVRFEFLERNHGQTPAFNINQIFEIAVLPNPLPAGFVFPSSTRRVDTNHTIFPADEAIGWFNAGTASTAAEVASVAAYTHKIHIWGVTTYLDAFKNIRETKFSASVGGQNFVQAQLLGQSGNFNGPPWNWEYESEHNDAT